MKKLQYFSLVTLVALISLAVSQNSPQNSALAQDSGQPVAKPCLGLDVVFLVSHSQSMNIVNDAKPSGAELSNLRERALKTAVNILVDNVVYLCPNYQHRLAIVGFGDLADSDQDAEDFVPPIAIDPTLSNYRDWTSGTKTAEGVLKDQSIFGKIETRYRDFKFDPAGSRGANFSAGLKRASEIFENWAKTTPDNLPRERSLIIISDANMCTQEDGCDFGTLIRKAQPYVEKNGKFIPSEISIDHIVFHNLDAGGTDFVEEVPVIKQFWETALAEHSGFYLDDMILQYENTNEGRRFAGQDIDSKIAKILGDRLGSDLGLAKCDDQQTAIQPFWVEPYQNNFLVLYIFRYGASRGFGIGDVDVSIEISQAGKTIATLRNGLDELGFIKSDQIRSSKDFSGATESYVIYAPPPGKYLVKIAQADPCKDVSIQTGKKGVTFELNDPVSTDANLAVQLPEIDRELTPDEKTHYFEMNLYQLDMEGEKLPLQEIEGYPLAVNVTVEQLYSKDGDQVIKQDTYHLVPSGSQAGSFRSQKPIDQSVPGYYKWTLTATTNNPRQFDTESPISSPIEVLKETGEFEVTHLERDFDYGFIPQLPSKVLLNSSNYARPLEIQIQVFGKDGKTPLREGLQIAPEGNSPFMASLFKQGDNTRQLISGPEPMKLQSGNIYTSTLGTGIEFEQGCYWIEVDLTDDYSPWFIPAKETSLEEQICMEKTKFSISYMEPVDKSELVLVDNKTSKALEVKVQITDKDSIAFSETFSLAQSPNELFEASLKDESEKVVIGPQKMRQESNNIYSATLGEPTSYSPGCYQIVVELKGKYITNLYDPVDQGPWKHSICFLQGERFDWSLALPEKEVQFSTRPALNWFAEPDLVNFLRIQVTSSNLDKSSSMLRDSVEYLFQGQLLEETTGSKFDVFFKPSEAPGEFIANWPEGAMASGGFVLQSVKIVPENLAIKWVPNVEEVDSTSFMLQETPWTMPWSGLAALLLGIIAIFTGVMVFLNNGRLFDTTISFLPGREARKPISGTIKTWGFLFTRKYIVNKKQIERQLTGGDIVKIIVTAITPTTDGARVAADVELVYEDESQNVPDVNEGDMALIGTGQKLALNKGQAGLLHRFWPTIVISLALFIIWLSVFALLYFQYIHIISK